MIGTPRAFDGTGAAAEAQRLSTTLLVIAAGWLAFFIQHVLTSMTRMAATDAIAVLLTFVVRHWALHGGHAERLRPGAHLAMVVSSGSLVAVSLFSGQDAAMATWYLTVVPLFVAYALGTRQAVIWAAISTILIVGVYVSPRFVHVEPDYIPNAATWLMGKLVLLGVLLGLAIATRRATDAYVDALAHREQIIGERATELAEARDAALAAVSAKNLFLANMSHEIRTPLHGIIGMTSVLLDAGKDDDQLEMVRTIQRSSNALLAILNEILDYSKLEASAVILERIPFDPRECVADAMDLLGRAAADKGLDMVVDIDPAVPRWVEGDVGHLRQVLLNLLGNAIKFTERGQVAIRVALRRDGLLHFFVCDTGIGIPPSRQDALFQSFSQVDASTTRKYGGTGLGLAISKRLIELMGGEIWVDSTPGVGSEFHFAIDAPPTQAPSRPSARHERLRDPAVAAVDPAMAARLPARILVGEDNPVNQRVAVTMLERLGYEPEVASTGLEVLAALETRDFDVVFLDLQMPAMDGIETTRRIRDMHGHRPWIVALTASVGDERREEALAAGMDNFVSKPFDIHALACAVENRASGAVPRAGGASAWDQLRTMFVDQPEQLADLVSQHRVNAGELIGAIEAAHAEGDAAGVRTTAHTLKSSAAQFGSDDVADLASRLELSPDDTDLVRRLREAWSDGARFARDGARSARDACPGLHEGKEQG